MYAWVTFVARIYETHEQQRDTVSRPSPPRWLQPRWQQSMQHWSRSGDNGYGQCLGTDRTQSLIYECMVECKPSYYSKSVSVITTTSQPARLLHSWQGLNKFTLTCTISSVFWHEKQFRIRCWDVSATYRASDCLKWWWIEGIPYDIKIMGGRL